MNIKDIQEIELIDIDKIEAPSYKRLGTLLNIAFNSINEILFYLKERDGEKCGVSDDRYYGTVGFCQNPKGSCSTHDNKENMIELTHKSFDTIFTQARNEGAKEERERIKNEILKVKEGKLYINDLLKELE